MPVEALCARPTRPGPVIAGAALFAGTGIGVGAGTGIASATEVLTGPCSGVVR